MHADGGLTSGPTTTSSPGSGDHEQRFHAAPRRGPGPCGVLNDSARRLRPCWPHARPRSRKRNVFAASRVGFSTRFLTRHERKLCINLKRKARDSAHENAFEYTSLMVEPVGSPWGSTRPKRPRPRVHRAHPARPNARALACTCSSPTAPRARLRGRPLRTHPPDPAPPARAPSSIPARAAARPSADDRSARGLPYEGGEGAASGIAGGAHGFESLPAPWWLARRQPKAGGPPLRVSRRGYGRYRGGRMGCTSRPRVE